MKLNIFNKLDLVYFHLNLICKIENDMKSNVVISITWDLGI